MKEAMLREKEGKQKFLGPRIQCAHFTASAMIQLRLGHPPRISIMQVRKRSDLLYLL